MNEETITASPLCWPKGKPRTPANKIKSANFGKRNEQGWGNKKLTLAQSRSRVLEEISRFTKVGRAYRSDPKQVIISTNLDLRLDGLPRSGQRKPDDTGVAVYFELDGKRRCIPCDNYNRIEDNLAAIAATISALRTIERHGSAMFEAAFTGFTAIPSPENMGESSWRSVLDYYGESLKEAEIAFKQKRKHAHPDHGGSTKQFSLVNHAWEQAKNELS